MDKKVLNFISSGVCCNALVLLNSLGIIDLLKSSKSFSLNKFLKTHPNVSELALKAAFITLEKMSIIEKKNSAYHLTNFGIKICDQIGLIKLLFQGYGQLIAEQTNIGQKKPACVEKYLNGEAIADASIQFSEKTIIPKIIKELKKRKIEGTLCDFGCGSAVHLIDICAELNLRGIGIELDKEAVALA